MLPRSHLRLHWFSVSEKGNLAAWPAGTNCRAQRRGNAAVTLAQTIPSVDCSIEGHPRQLDCLQLWLWTTEVVSIEGSTHLASASYSGGPSENVCPSRPISVSDGAQSFCFWYIQRQSRETGHLPMCKKHPRWLGWPKTNLASTTTSYPAVHRAHLFGRLFQQTSQELDVSKKVQRSS